MLTIEKDLFDNYCYSSASKLSDSKFAINYRIENEWTSYCVGD